MTEILSPGSARSGQPRTGASDESTSTHERLLEAAASLFAECGYGGTSMADIAERVGVRKASLYNYYAAKEDILMELLRRSLEAAHASCVPALQAPGPYAERLWNHFRDGVTFAACNPELVAIFRVAATQIGGELGERADRLISDHRTSLRRELLEFFRQAREDGAVADESPRDLSYVFRMFFNGVLTGHLGACDIDERLDEERLEQVWRVFWRGIGGEA